MARPDSKQLNNSGLEQMDKIKAAMKSLAKLRTNLEDLQSGRKPTPPKGEKPPPLLAAGTKRKTQGDDTPAPKNRKSAGLSRPKAYPEVPDTGDDMHASKPIAEWLRNSPRLSPSKPPTRLGKGKGKGRGRGKGQDEKPNVARSLNQKPADDPATSSSDPSTTSDEVDPDADNTSNDEEADDNDEIQEE